MAPTPTNGIPAAPVVPGLILGPIIEQKLWIVMITSHWHLTQFFARPVFGLFGWLTILAWCAPLPAALVARRLRTGAGSESKG